jgi:hypothetical protein
MRRLIIIPALLSALYSCGQEQKTHEEYPLQVGDIYFNPKIDNPDFKVCDDDRVFQYYNLGKGLQYKGEKSAITKYFKVGLNSKGLKEDTGYITIRFIVNCKGEIGRFRVQEMDNDFNEKEFSVDFKKQLLNLTKQMSGWMVGEYEGKAYDYYQYLTFKIDSGNLVEIMP